MLPINKTNKKCSGEYKFKAQWFTLCGICYVTLAKPLLCLSKVLHKESVICIFYGLNLVVLIGMGEIQIHSVYFLLGLFECLLNFLLCNEKVCLAVFAMFVLAALYTNYWAIFALTALFLMQSQLSLNSHGQIKTHSKGSDHGFI